MKTLFCFIILIGMLALSCKHRAQPGSENQDTLSYLKALQKRKASIDKMPSKDASALTVFVKMSNKNELVRIFNGKFPEDSIECTYNLLTEKGKVIMIDSSPFSESGDWAWHCTHYFDKDGRTFAYEKRANAFALPNDGIAFETTANYFDTHFKIISHKYKLVDKNNRALRKEYAFNRKGFDNKEYSTAEQCLKAYNIRLPE